MEAHQQQHEVRTGQGLTGNFGQPAWRLVGSVIMMTIMVISVDVMAQTVPEYLPEPNMAFQSLEGEPFEVFAIQNSVVLLNFWGTWCGPCLDEIPHLIEMNNQFGPAGLRVVGVAVASGSNKEIQAFIQAQGINYKVVIGGMDQVKGIFHVRGFPSSLLIDRAGVIQKRYFGPQTVAGLRNDITRLLSVSLPGN